MIGPVRAVYAMRPHAAPGILAAAVAVSAMFAATPFVIPEVADRYDISLAAAGLISSLQVGGFALTSFTGGRLLRPSRRLMVSSAAVAIVANALSAVNEVYSLLLPLRLVSGAAAGILVWIAWTDAMQGRRQMASVAAAGPLTALTMAPIMAALGQVGDDRAIYAAMAVTVLPVLFLPARIDGVVAARRRFSPSRSNVMLLATLGVMTMAGSSLFVFASALAEADIGMSALAASIGFSINAGAGLSGTRFRARPGTAALWMLGPAVAATSMVLIASPVVFYLAMALWGFAFWMAVPELFRQIGAWSLAPEERVGDAQALMAVGRAVGPLAGGAMLTAGSFTSLGLAAGAGLLLAALGVGAVERYRRRNPDANPNVATG